MNESRRAVAHVPGVRMYCTGCGAVRGASVSSCVLLWLFCGRDTAEVSRGSDVSLPQINYLKQWRSREDGRGGGGLEKRRLYAPRVA